MERLIIENFGPIKSADIVIKKTNILIGCTSSGKSTIAKLIAIVNSLQFHAIHNEGFSLFCKQLNKYNINFGFHENTAITYTNSQFSWTIKKDYFETTNDLADIVSKANTEEPLLFLKAFIEKYKQTPNYKGIIKSLKPVVDINSSVLSFDLEHIKDLVLDLMIDENDPIYIPAERLLITTFSDSLYGLLSENINIPECIKTFGKLYETARKIQSSCPIDFMSIDVKFSTPNGDTITLKDHEEIKVTQASSGIQALIPLWVVFDGYTKKDTKTRKELIIVEEPELNLFPNNQVDLLNQMMIRINDSKCKLVITTHSPYILSAMDNLILAFDVAKINKGDTCVSEKINNIIPSNCHVNFDNVSSYFFNDKGCVQSTLDYEYRCLGAEYIDGASNTLGLEFDDLSAYKTIKS